MLNTFKHYLGIEALEDDRQFYRQQWTQMLERFLAINDHLIEIKELIKTHDVQMDKKVFNNHIDVLTRFGMVLTALDKVTALPTLQSGSAEILPEETLPVQPVRSGRGRPKKMKGIR